MLWLPQFFVVAQETAKYYSGGSRIYKGARTRRRRRYRRCRRRGVWGGDRPLLRNFFSILDLKMATSGVFWALFFTVQLRVSYIIALPTGAANYAQNVTVDTARGKDASIIYLKK